MTATAPAPVAPPTLFDRTTDLRSRSAHEHEAVLDESWRSLSGVHGGYQVALSVLAAERAEPHREVRTVATSFLRPARPGPATLLVERVRRGRAITTLSVRLLQRGRAAATSRITMVEQRVGADWHQPVDLGVVPPAQAMEAIAAGRTAEALRDAPPAAPLYEQARQLRRRAAWSDLRKGIVMGAIGLGLVFHTMLEDGSPNGLGLVLLFVVLRAPGGLGSWIARDGTHA